MPSASANDLPHSLRLAEKIGLFIEYWGFKQVHGKIWTLIFLSTEPVDANYIKETLKISKALTSMSLKDLLYYNVIQEVAKEKPGTQKYCINPNIAEVIFDIIYKRELKMLLEIQACCEDLEKTPHQSESPTIDTKRVNELSSMVKAANSLLSGMTAGDKVDFKVFDEVMCVDE